MKPKGVFCLEHYRNGKLLQKIYVNNGTTVGGINKALDILFGSDSKISNWYCGLINSSGYTGVNEADTMASHTGWTEFTDYSGNRQAWTPAAASSKAVSNTTPMSFVMTGGGIIKGLFCASNNTKGGTSGTLWATALFASDIAVVTSDELKLTYEVSA